MLGDVSHLSWGWRGRQGPGRLHWHNRVSFVRSDHYQVRLVDILLVITGLGQNNNILMCRLGCQLCCVGGTMFLTAKVSTWCCGTTSCSVKIPSDFIKLPAPVSQTTHVGVFVFSLCLHNAYCNGEVEERQEGGVARGYYYKHPSVGNSSIYHLLQGCTLDCIHMITICVRVQPPVHSPELTDKENDLLTLISGQVSI